MLLSAVALLVGIVLIVFGLILSTDGIEARRRRAQTTVATGHRTERVTDEVVVRRRITKERMSL